MEKDIWQMVWITADDMHACKMGSFLLISYFIDDFMVSRNILLCKFLLI